MMTEAEWFAVVAPEHMLAWVAPRCTERQLRLFAVACCRRVARLCRPRFESTLRQAEEVADAPPGKRPGRRERVRVPRLASLWMSRGESILAHALSSNSARAAARQASERAVALARGGGAWCEERWFQASYLCDIVGNPFRRVAFAAEWLTSTVVAIARGMYESRDFGAMPILADALQDAGCDSEEVLTHCRELGPHVRGCWVVDLVLGKS